MGSPEKPCSGTLGDRLKGRIPLVRLRLALPIDYPSSEDPLHKVSEESLFWSNHPPSLKGHKKMGFRCLTKEDLLLEIRAMDGNRRGMIII
jgi:hypothetical protein